MALGQVVGDVQAGMIEEGEEVVALLALALAHGFFVALLAGRLQQGFGLRVQALATPVKLRRRERRLVAQVAQGQGVAQELPGLREKARRRLAAGGAASWAWRIAFK